MNHEHIKISEILEKVTPKLLTAKDIHIEMNLYTEIGLTSFDLLQVMYMIEVECSVKINMSDYMNVTTVEGLIELVKRKKEECK